jgi:hypothetical protein
MDGEFPVNDGVAIRDLANRIAPTLIADESRYSDLWDLDEVFWESYPRPWNIQRAMEAFAQIVDIYKPWAGQLAAVLQIWHTQTEDLSRAVPLIEGTLIDINPVHPPTVGFVKRVRKIPAPYEHYQSPFRQRLVKCSWGTVHAYYECFRTAEAIAGNEAYDRVLVFSHWE